MTRCTTSAPMCGRSCKKSSVRIGEEPVAAWPEVPLNIVDVEMKSGKVLSTKVAYHLGHFKRFMTDERTGA